jgi:choline dehydrogenase-like flavoprotein
MLTPQERRLRLLLRILAGAFGLAIFAYLLPALGGPLQPFFVNLPFVTNSVVKIGVLALLAYFAAADVRQYRLLTGLLIAGHAISEVATAAVLLWGDTGYDVAVAGRLVPVRSLLWGAIALDGVILALLGWFYAAAERARYHLAYFSPTEFRALCALAEVVVMGENEVIEAETVAYNVDRYLASFRARNKWLAKVVMAGVEIYPVLTGKPPFSHQSADDRKRFITRRFYHDVERRLVPGFWRDLVQGMIRMAKQLTYLGYYNDPRSFDAVGYVPFSRRPEFAERILASPLREHLPLAVTRAADLTSATVEGDVVIIGSGAAGSVLAHELAQQGRDVLLLERGGHERQETFVEDEVEMLSRLYADGALQLSRDFRFQILQGSCVGGSTVVNNAVCFDLPPAVLARWNAPDLLDGALDTGRLATAFQGARELIGVARQEHAQLNRSGTRFLAGLRAQGFAAPPHHHGAVEANIAGCVGCGYCNIGCLYGKKLSMLDTVLPQTQHAFNRDGREALRILSDCEVVKIRRSGNRVTALECETPTGRKLTVKGTTYVLAAGAVSSSMLLLKSKLGGPRVGKNLSFNLGSPLTAAFDEPVRAYEGLQISHFLEPVPDQGFVVETWYNPPVAQALTMPGWFDDHFNNMRRYDRLASVGILVGTEANAEVRLGLLAPRDIKYTPTDGDLAKLLAGLVTAGEIWFAAGAKTVMPHTFTYHEFHSVEELRRLPELVKDGSDLTLGTGHPQGGNILSLGPDQGVVDPEFRVHGLDNLFVCDASVFPTSIKVNPQLTVMALARYAAPMIARHGGRAGMAAPLARRATG